MIQSFTVTNPNGKSMVCELTNPWKEGLAVASIDGLGPGQATINVADISSMDGGRFNSARKSARNITFTLIFTENDTLTVEDIRRKCYTYFPIKKQVKLKFTTGNGKTFKDYYIEGRVESNEPTIFSSSEGATVSILCPNPYFYRSFIQEERFNASSTPEFSFAFSKDPENPTDAATKLRFGDIVNYIVSGITYEGEADTGLIFEIGFRSDFPHDETEKQYIEIINSLTDTINRISINKVKKILDDLIEDYEGIKVGDKLVFSTVKGDKYLTFIHGNTSYNVLSAVESSGEWVYLTSGLNMFRINVNPSDVEISASTKNKIYFYGV